MARRTIAVLARLEAERSATPAATPIPDGWYGWEPYHLDACEQLFAAAARALRGRRPAGPLRGRRRLIDAGCGIGTKAALAGRWFDPHGIEWIPEYAAQARRLGVTVYEQDMRTFTGWDRFHVVYLNHPATSRDTEAALEAGIAAQMARGAILVKVWDSLGAPPGRWETITETHEPGNRDHGAWLKAG